MRLTSASIARTMAQFEAKLIPDDHPLAGQLNETFGDHSFFIDSEGLHIVEPTNPDQRRTNTASVVKIASWDDVGHTRLLPQDPEPIDVVVELAPDEPSTET